MSSNPIEKWSSDSCRSWLERFEIIMADEGVTDEKKTVLKLLKFLGAEGYDLVRRLASPKQPTEETYKTLKELLIMNVDPEPTQLLMRYRFWQLKQGQTDNTTTWLSNVKYQASRCEFKKEEVRDQFIFGLLDEDVRFQLLEMEKPSLEDAVTKAMARERARNDLTNFKPSYVNYMEHKKSHRSFHKPDAEKPSSSKTSSTSSRERPRCSKCGCQEKTSGCREGECQTRCYRCGTMGHIQQKCYKGKKKHVNQLDESDDEKSENVSKTTSGGGESDVSSGLCDSDIKTQREVLNYLTINKVNKVSKVLYTVNIEGCDVSFEIDTGSAITCISRSLFNSYFPGRIKDLERARHAVKVANGTTIDSVHVCSVSISRVCLNVIFCLI